MSKHGKPPGHKPPGDRKQKSNGKRGVKEKTVAAEIGAALMREEAPKPAHSPVSRPVRPLVAKEKAVEPAPVSRSARPMIVKAVEKEKPVESPPAAPPARRVVAKEVEKTKAPESPPVAPAIPRVVAKDAEKQKPLEAPPASRPAPSAPRVVAQEAERKKPLESAPPLLGNPLDTIERSFKAAGQGAIAVNQKLIDFARANMSSGFDFAMSLATASSPMQMVQLQVSYWDQRMKVLASQAEELRALSADLMAKTSEPLRQHIWTKRSSAV
jgi:Phasin protein